MARDHAGQFEGTAALEVLRASHIQACLANRVLLC